MGSWPAARRIWVLPCSALHPFLATIIGELMLCRVWAIFWEISGQPAIQLDCIVCALLIARVRSSQHRAEAHGVAACSNKRKTMHIGVPWYQGTRGTMTGTYVLPLTAADVRTAILALAQCGQRPLHGSEHSNPTSPSTLSHRYTLASLPSPATVRSLSNNWMSSQGASPLQPNVATMSPRSVPRALPQCMSLILNLEVSQPPGTPL
jgi:hypothetical protein